MKPVLVIYNPAAGSYNNVKNLRLVWKNSTNITFQRLNAHLARVIKQAARKGCRTVIAVGGDGTVSSVAACLKGTSLSLGIIPAGTLNHFAKDLGIPLELDKAMQTALQGRLQKIDTASVNGQIFINNSSIGLYPHVVQERDKQKSSLGKWPAALVALIKILPSIKKYSVRLTIDGQTYDRVTPFIFVGNNSYHIDAFGFNNRTRLDRGELCVYIVNTSKIARILRVFFRALSGRAEQDRDFEAFRATHVELAVTRHELLVAYDGEVIELRAPLSYKVEPKSLRVLLPR